MTSLRGLTATVIAVLLMAGCSDVPTAPDLRIGEAGPRQGEATILDPVVVIGTPQPGCDPSTDLNFCQGDDGGECMTGISPSLGDFSTVSGCNDTGGSRPPANPAPQPPVEPTPVYEGPGAFAACVGTLLLLMGTTASLDPLAHSLYEARNNYDSARRMYDAVMANNPTLEMELLYAHRVDVAKNGYDDAVRDYALGAGATVIAVGGAVLVCSPGLLLPTP